MRRAKGRRDSAEASEGRRAFAGVSETVLVVALPFGARLNAADVAKAIAAGLLEGGLPQPDLCPLDREAAPGASAAQAASATQARSTAHTRPRVCAAVGAEDRVGVLPADFDARLKAARAVVIAATRLDEDTLLASLPFEIATRARQAGVPCYAVARENALDLFDARILDLQVVLEARTPQALQEAGRDLSRIV